MQIRRDLAQEQKEKELKEKKILEQKQIYMEENKKLMEENEKKVLYRGAWTKEKKKEGNQCVYHEIDNGNFFFWRFCK